MTADDPDPVRLVPATAAHLDLLVATRNDPDSARFSKRGTLSAEEIERDFLHREDKRVMVAEVGGEPAGYVAYETGEDTVEIGIALHPAHRGRGLGSRVLEAGTQHARDALGVRAVYADIFPENARSVALFEQMGYELIDDTAEPHRYRYVPSE